MRSVIFPINRWTEDIQTSSLADGNVQLATVRGKKNIRDARHNEDSAMGLEDEAKEIVVAAVADGVGGRPAGHVASEVALQALSQADLNMSHLDVLRACRQKLVNRLQILGSLSTGYPATTIAFTVLRRVNGVFTAESTHLGDSRIMWINPNYDDVGYVSADDSKMTSIYRRSYNEQAEWRIKNYQDSERFFRDNDNLITRSLSSNPHREVESYSTFTDQFKEEGHIILMMTDLIPRVMTYQEILAVYKMHGPKKAPAELLKKALEKDANTALELDYGKRKATVKGREKALDDGTVAQIEVTSDLWEN